MKPMTQKRDWAEDWMKNVWLGDSGAPETWRWWTTLSRSRRAKDLEWTHLSAMNATRGGRSVWLAVDVRPTLTSPMPCGYQNHSRKVFIADKGWERESKDQKLPKHYNLRYEKIVNEACWNLGCKKSFRNPVLYIFLFLSVFRGWILAWSHCDLHSLREMALLW